MSYEKSKNNGITEYIWEPHEGQVKGVIYVIHGMAEHLKRYNNFALYMNKNGYVVCGIDLPGHGESIEVKKGFFAEEDGGDKVVSSILDFNQKIRAKYPNIKIICLGHSMGSFFAEYIACNYPTYFDSFIFSGTAGKNNLLWLAKLIAKREIKKNGTKHESVLLNNLSFGSYNKAFKPEKTEFDWLSSDFNEVSKYVNDDLCGFVFTSSAFYDVFKIMEVVASKTWASMLDRDKKYLFISGLCDPVGSKGKGVKYIAESMKKACVNDVKVILYEGKRHEVLNEVNREEVYLDVLTFAKEVTL